ncbi:MAG TPA: glycosyltransferase family 4 protein [Magnetovibrio sp.]
MRICVLGAASSAHVMARAKVFAEFGHDVTLVTPAQGDTLGLNAAVCARGDKGRLGWLASVFAAVNGANADIYHAHYAAELTTWMAWLLGKRPLVVTVMGGDVLFDEQGSLGPVGRWLTRRAVRAAALVTVKSPLLGDIVASWGVQRERIMNVVWGVDARIFSPNAEGAAKRRAEWGVGADDTVLFSPRMLKPLYNQLLMVEALVKVPGAQLVLSTYNEDPAYRERVQTRANELDVADRLRFVSAVSAPDMAASYSAADVVLSLPPSDGTPQSVMEAMACGAPVVMTDLDRFKPLFTHGETGWFTRLDADALATSVTTLLGDDDLRAHIAANAKMLIKEQADFETQARAVEARMLQLLGNA